MKFIETKLKGSYIVEPERLEDERGFFARTFCQKEFGAYGLNPRVAQCNISYNRRKGTLRGMHYQIEPMAEDKLVHCTNGAIYDVIIDLRRDSATYCQWLAVELNDDNRWMLYIPKGFAHGFQTLVDDTEVFYHMSEFYALEFARGVRWNDPFFSIKWPVSNPVLSEKDRNYKGFKP
jgi:dTDP-4-dehydrorhamnose 3,5-epimerase